MKKRKPDFVSQVRSREWGRGRATRMPDEGHSRVILPDGTEIWVNFGPLAEFSTTNTKVGERLKNRLPKGPGSLARVFTAEGQKWKQPFQLETPTKAYDLDPLKWLAQLPGIQELRQRIYSLILARYSIYPDSGLKDLSKHFSETLDFIKLAIEQKPELRAQFESHSLLANYVSIRRDVPAAELQSTQTKAEIEKTVRIKWADRQKPRFAKEDWSKDPISFVRHVYGKWYDGNLLLRAHLLNDPPLYAAYGRWVAKHGDPLALPAVPKEGYDRGKNIISGSVRASVWIPTAQLSEEERKSRRAREAAKKQRQRKAKVAKQKVP